MYDDDPTGPPLPPAYWGDRCQPLRLTMAQYEKIIAASENVLRLLLVEENYDSVSNFLWMAESFMMTGGPLCHFLEMYHPPLRANRSTCVGLAFQLLLRLHDLDPRFPGLASNFALVSCEEDVDDIEGYVRDGHSPDWVERIEKEHVLVCAKVYIDGRLGVILADPGYHIAKFITVMADRQYPHSGWQLHMYSAEYYKEIHYVFNADNFNYIEWHELKTKDGLTAKEIALIYISQPFLSSVAVTEKRNLVYELKSVLARDYEGQVKAGLFFKVRPRDTQFTLVVDHGEYSNRIKVDFSTFLDLSRVSPHVKREISLCNIQLGFKNGELFDMICRLARILDNEYFVNEMLHMDAYIKSYCRFRPRYFFNNGFYYLY